MDNGEEGLREIVSDQTRFWDVQVPIAGNLEHASSEHQVSGISFHRALCQKTWCCPNKAFGQPRAILLSACGSCFIKPEPLFRYIGYDGSSQLLGS